MTKSEFIDAVAAKTGKPKTEASEIVDAVFDTITESLTRGDDVGITGFGTFRVTERKAREGVNPRTGEKIFIEAKMTPKFRPGKSLKEAVA